MSILKQGVTLYDNQHIQHQIMAKRKRALLVDKPGAGKTLTVLSAFGNLYERSIATNLLVFTPLSAYQKLVWKKECQIRTTLKSIDLLDLKKLANGSRKRLALLLQEYPVIYAKHTSIINEQTFVRVLMEVPRMVVCLDEAHKFKNPKTGLAATARVLFHRAFALWALTATPLSKNLVDTYQICNFVKPFCLGSLSVFKATHCLVDKKIIGRLPHGRGFKYAEMVLGCKDYNFLRDCLADLIIEGYSTLDVHWHWESYTMSEFEDEIYTRLAYGVTVGDSEDDAEWAKEVLSGPTLKYTVTKKHLKDATKHSTRYIYLQSAANGMLSQDGTFTRKNGTKTLKLLSLLDDIVGKGESVMIYCSYYSTVDILKEVIASQFPTAQVIESSGRKVLDDNAITVDKVKMRPHIVLCTKASSESASYYFLKHVIMFEIPTVPDTFTQMIGRITRRNTLYPDDLHGWIFVSDNIDRYKMIMVSVKSYQVEGIVNEEKNIPPDYKLDVKSIDFWDDIKKRYLWRC